MTHNRQPRRISQTAALRAKAIVLAVAIGASIVSAGLARPRSNKKRHPATAQDLPDQINNLVSQLNGVQLVDADGVPAQVQELVIGALTAWMNREGFKNGPAGYPTDVRVRTTIDQYFSKLHYPFFGTPAAFVEPWNGGDLIGAGYTLGWSDFDRVSVLALYHSKGGQTRRVGIVPFVPGPEMHFAFLPPSPAGAFRFMIFGNRLGKSQPRLSVILYSFDGAKVDNLWEKQDLYDGKMDVKTGTVTLRYLIEQEYIQAVQQQQLPQWHEEVYHVTPQGLALATERRVPFKSAS